MTNDNADVTIRTPVGSDVDGIIAVVKACEPLIHAYIPYFYWFNVQYFFETCAVAESAGYIVGWCSVMPGQKGKYFLHQLGVSPEARSQQMGTRLVSHVIETLRQRGDFELGLTIARDNAGSRALFTAIAKKFGLRLAKAPDEIELLIRESNEDLYFLTPASSSSVSQST